MVENKKISNDLKNSLNKFLIISISSHIFKLDINCKYWSNATTQNSIIYKNVIMILKLILPSPYSKSEYVKLFLGID